MSLQTRRGPSTMCCLRRRGCCVFLFWTTRIELKNRAAPRTIEIHVVTKHSKHITQEEMVALVKMCANITGTSHRRVFEHLLLVLFKNGICREVKRPKVPPKKTKNNVCSSYTILLHHMIQFAGTLFLLTCVSRT